MTPKRAVIYVRVSTTDQAEKGVSLDNQERSCHDWAFRNQIQVLRVFREEGRSAKTLNRPEVMSMLDYFNDHHQEIDYLIVYQIDRLTRSLFDFTDFMKMLVQYKIELRDSASNIESNESDELIQGMHALIAQHENKLKSKRVLENMKRHAALGYRMHQAPYGLKNVRDESGRPTLEPLPIISVKIASLLTSFAKGTYTKSQLLHEARKIDLKQSNGKPMSYQYLDKILRKPIYAGLEQSSLTDGQLIPSSFAGIVPEWVYHTNQALLESRQNHKIEGYKLISPEYVLRRFVLCGNCGKPLRGSAPTGRHGKKYPRYHCSTKGCNSAYVIPKELHKKWEDHLKELQPNDERFKLLQTVIVRVWKDEVKNMHLREKQLRERLDALKEQRLKAVEKLVAGEITNDEKTEMVNSIKKKVGTMQGQLHQLENRMGTREDAIDYCVSYIANARRIWKRASPEWKQVYQRMIYPQGISYNFKSGQFGTAKMSHLYRLANMKKDPSKSEESSMVIPRGIEPLLSG
ncbi:MAG: recombinase family protein [Candidatus Saccharimonadales bacterium]